MSEDRIIRNMRHMAWERAKGELKGMAHTYWDQEDEFKRFEAVIDAFISEVEDNGLHE